MNKIKILVLVLVTSFLSGCLLTTSYSTITLNGKPAKISLAETGCCYRVPLELSINGEVLGLTEWGGKAGANKLKPLKTKYGTFTASMEDDLTLIEPKLWWDIFLDGEYIGMVDYP